MNSGLIGKVDKAKKYAQERNRMHVQNTHHVALEDETWRCSCDFFEGWGACAHTMALERVLEGMIPTSVLMTPALRSA